MAIIDTADACHRDADDPGASRPESITDSVRSADLALTAEELDALEVATRG